MASYLFRNLPLISFVFLASLSVRAEDWPQWRYDAARSATSPGELPDELHLQWTRQLPAPRPSWPASQPSLRFDVSYSPIAAEGMLFVPSMVTDTVTAYDVATGEQRWQFFTDGPVRFAPVFHDGKIYAGSDDGHLYCLDADSGKLRWRVRGGPNDRRILGNRRLVSTWPVRGGPVVHGGVVYFTAGIWPFMGIFVCAVDAETGETVWSNSGESMRYQIHPHGAPSFGGLVPRGHLAVNDQGLVAPGGRTPPGIFSLKTGDLTQFKFSGKGGRSVHRPATISVGGRKFTPGEGKVTGDGFEAEVDGDVWSLLAANDRLFAVTNSGKIYCYGAAKGTPKTYDLEPSADGLEASWKSQAEAILKAADTDAGYGLVLGMEAGKLAEAIVRTSEVRVVVIDPDAQKIDAFRRRMIDAGLYGTHVAALVGDAKSHFPPYFANVVTSENLKIAQGDGDQFVRTVFRSLRPYGGTAYLQIDTPKLAGMAKDLKLENAVCKPTDAKASLLIREGSLPGAADWTHNYADPANTGVSNDTRVRLPLGLLWFGGPSNDEVLPRHGHGPSPQVAGGRLVIEGANMLRALDIYSGRLLWQIDLPGLGTFYNTTRHQPGAEEIGSNYVTLADSVYVVYGEKILKLDAATGKTQMEIPSSIVDTGARNWASIAALGDCLVATCEPATIGKDTPVFATKVTPVPNDFVPLIKRHATWHYHADGAKVPEGWTSVDFDQSGWKTGAAGFGYGDGDDNTSLDMKDKYATVYIRKIFDGEDASDAKEAILRVSYDDGFIAYLNGKEIARSHVKKNGNKIRATGHEAGRLENFKIENFRSLLRSGKNVFALEGHNQNLGSSDFSLDPMVLIQGQKKKEEQQPEAHTLDRFFAPAKYSSASRHLIVLDRNTGKERWRRDAHYGFRHNNIVLGNGKVFCIDGLSPAKYEAIRRRGLEETYRPRLLCLDIRTGDVIWETGKNVFGTFLNYSAKHDVLLQGGSRSRDRARDEVGSGMIAYQGKDGTVLWEALSRSYAGPCLLHDDTVIAQGPGYSLLTGEPKKLIHPLTETEMDWVYRRNYGCNTAIAAQNLITFRSGAAGFYDIENHGGTGNFGGFKSSCTSNLIVAGGVLIAPDYTRTCSCNYQNQTSLALVHDPTADVWTFNSFPWGNAPVRRVGVNFGAPGDRRVGRETLWLDFPSDGGTSPDIPVEIDGDARYHRQYSGNVTANDEGAYPWVAASVIEGPGKIVLTLAGDNAPATYTVRLHFAELEKDAKEGDRVFDVKLQGKDVLTDFDIAKEAGGTRRAIVKEFPRVEATGKLTIGFTAKEGVPTLSGIEVILE